MTDRFGRTPPSAVRGEAAALGGPAAVGIPGTALVGAARRHAAAVPLRGAGEVLVVRVLLLRLRGRPRRRVGVRHRVLLRALRTRRAVAGAGRGGGSGPEARLRRGAGLGHADVEVVAVCDGLVDLLAQAP